MTPQELLKLAATAKSPEARALLNVNLALEGHPAMMRAAVEAVAVPHWFDAPVLAALLDLDLPAASSLYEQLKQLSFVEPFHAHQASNLHEVTRRALLIELLHKKVETYRDISTRAHKYFDGRDDPAWKLEALYHQLIADPKAGITTAFDLHRLWCKRGNTGRLQACAFTLEEHLLANRIEGLSKAWALVLVAFILRSYQPLARSAQQMQEALEIFRAEKNLEAEAIALNFLGGIDLEQKRLAEALSHFNEVVKIRQEMLDADQARLANWQRLLEAHQRVGDTHAANKKYDLAVIPYDLSSRLAAELVKLRPEDIDCQLALYDCLDRLGTLQMDSDKPADALTPYASAKGLIEKIAASDPDNLEWQSSLFVSHFHMGDVLHKLERFGEALEAYHTALQIAEGRAAFDPKNTEYQRYLTATLNNIGDVLRSQRKYAEALGWYEKANVIREALIGFDPDNVQWREDLEETRANIEAVRGMILSAKVELGSSSAGSTSQA